MAKATKEPTQESLDLSAFDYKNMNGQPFIDYAEFVSKINMNEHRFFDVFKVDTIKKQRYPGMKGSPNDVSGFRITNDTPVHSTKIQVKDANNMNGIVLEEGICVSAQFENTKRIYLLKK